MSYLVVLVFVHAAGAYDLCDLSNFTFTAYDGNGSGKLVKNMLSECDGVEMRSSDSAGFAGSYSLGPLPVQGGRRLNATFFIRTHDLVPIPGGPEAGAPTLTGGIYLHYHDFDRDSGAWSPQFGTLAPSNTGESSWLEQQATFVVPTTAATVDIHLAFAAHTFKGTRMTGGRATGRLSIAGIKLTDAGAASPLPPTIKVDDPLLQAALTQAFDCLHNSQQSGNFTVGAGYTISDNMSPDLMFGLHGLRRTGIRQYVETMQRQWEWHAPRMPSGEYYLDGRVMGQIYWPLGVDNLFSFTGDVAYLKRLLPVVDASLEFVHQHTDANGFATLVPVGKGVMGGGADWVDWETTRLDGRSLMFQMWHYRTLTRFAELHTEFSSTFGSATTASLYRQRANSLKEAISRLYWRRDHWLTNQDYADASNGTVGWLDDVVWSINLGVANASQSAQLWSIVDANAVKFEAVPTTWTAFPTRHGYCSWFGRLGGGDIMARYKHSQAQRAFDLLQSFAGTVVRHGNIYEGYDMNGCGLAKCGCTTSGFGDYLEHCAGLIWTVVEGLFGLDFDSRAAGSHGNGRLRDDSWMARIEPHFPKAWRNASMTTFVRGSQLKVEWSQPGNRLTLSVGKGDANVRIKVVGCSLDAESVVVVTYSSPFVAECSSVKASSESIAYV